MITGEEPESKDKAWEGKITGGIVHHGTEREIPKEAGLDQPGWEVGLEKAGG
jgi:hypothetical protein